MGIKNTRKYYGVPAKRGGRVRCTGGKIPVEGRITGVDSGGRLRVVLDGESRRRTYHPTWKVEYL